MYSGRHGNELLTFDDGIKEMQMTKQRELERLGQHIIAIKQTYATYRYELENIEKKSIKQLMEETYNKIDEIDTIKTKLIMEKYSQRINDLISQNEELKSQNNQLLTQNEEFKIEKSRLVQFNAQQQNVIQELQSSMHHQYDNNNIDIDDNMNGYDQHNGNNGHNAFNNMPNFDMRQTRDTMPSVTHVTSGGISVSDGNTIDDDNDTKISKESKDSNASKSSKSSKDSKRKKSKKHKKKKKEKKETKKTWIYCRHKRIDDINTDCGVHFVRPLKKNDHQVQHQCHGDRRQHCMTRTFNYISGRCELAPCKDGNLPCIRYATIEEIENTQTRWDKLKVKPVVFDLGPGFVSTSDGSRGNKDTKAIKTDNKTSSSQSQPRKKRKLSSPMRKRKRKQMEQDTDNDSDDNYEPKLCRYIFCDHYRIQCEYVFDNNLA